MRNARLNYLMQQLRWEGKPLTQTWLAKALMTSRSHLNQVLNNVPHRGGQTRRKAALWFTTHFPAETPALLRALGWDAHGNISLRASVRPRARDPETKMKTSEFQSLMRQLIWEGKRLTQTRLAKALMTSRPHLNQVLNNVPHRGGQTRRKVALWFTTHFPAEAPALLRALGWDAHGAWSAAPSR